MKKKKMQSEKNNYIGDDKFLKMLEHYQCPTPLSVIKMRFAGAICSPNLELRPADVISSLWPEGQSPRLETKEEADLFFKFFMGLWDEMFTAVSENKVTLPAHKFHKDTESLKLQCDTRLVEVEYGFVEGFWGGRQDLQLPAFIARMVDSLSELSGVYGSLVKKLDKGTDLDEIVKTLSYTDKMVEKAVAFIIENSVLPRIESLRRTVIN